MTYDRDREHDIAEGKQHQADKAREAEAIRAALRFEVLEPCRLLELFVEAGEGGSIDGPLSRALEACNRREYDVANFRLLEVLAVMKADYVRQSVEAIQ